MSSHHEAHGGDLGDIINDIDIKQGGGSAGSSANAPPSDSSILAPHEDDNDDQLLEKQKKWVKEMHGSLMVMASLAAMLANQSVRNLPAGFSQDDKAGPNRHNAGDLVMRYKYPGSYVIFISLNTVAFLTSIFIMGLVSSERFYGTQAKMVALVLITLIDATCLVCAFIYGSSPHYPSRAFLDLLGPVIICFLVFLAICIGMATWKLLRCLYHLAKHWRNAGRERQRASALAACGGY